jgi:CYTH domain-containing protein
MSSEKVFNDFEFERRFFCKEISSKYFEGARSYLMVQSYFLANEGYSIRIRVQAKDAYLNMSENLDTMEVVKKYEDKFSYAFCVLKGPAVGGTRYESVTEIDVNVALEMIKRNPGKAVVKNRYYVWIGEDGWILDVFGGKNHPLIIAECERSMPVIDLKIPSFCITEITDEKRFGNDSLTNHPFSYWSEEYADELKTKGPKFSKLFGENTFLSDK